LARRIGATASGLLPTPVANDARRSTAGEYDGKRGAALIDRVGTWRLPPGQGGTWATPTTQDAHNNGGPAQYRRKRSIPLNAQVRLWPTPKSSPSGPDYARINRPRSGGDDLATAVARTVNGGQLNPTWVEWLMGFPLGWTDCGVLATRSSRRSRRGSASAS
jgi:hypothetical protein